MFSLMRATIYMTNSTGISCQDVKTGIYYTGGRSVKNLKNANGDRYSFRIFNRRNTDYTMVQVLKLDKYGNMTYSRFYRCNLIPKYNLICNLFKFIRHYEIKRNVKFFGNPDIYIVAGDNLSPSELIQFD